MITSEPFERYARFLCEYYGCGTNPDFRHVATHLERCSFFGICELDQDAFMPQIITYETAPDLIRRIPPVTSPWWLRKYRELVMYEARAV